MSYRKSNMFKSTWARATQEQRQEFRDALAECVKVAERHRREMLPAADRLDRACSAMWKDKRPKELDCADTEMRLSPWDQVRRALFEVSDYLGPGWDFDVGTIHTQTTSG